MGAVKIDKEFLASEKLEEEDEFDEGVDDLELDEI
jgi:hypothetical protein